MSDSDSGIWPRIRSRLSVTEQLCRECNRPVVPWETICPSCGIRNPVKIQRWIATVMLFLLVLPLIS